MMTPEWQQLVSRVFLSRHFSYADSLRRILQYLCDHASAPDAKPLKEYELAVFALGRPDSFDPKTDPVIRVSMASIRDRLRAYFEDEGRSETTTLSVPKGRYMAVFAERTDAVPTTPPPVLRPERPALSRFWKPYFQATPGNNNVLMYTEPLFFRGDKNEIYQRGLHLNAMRDERLSRSKLLLLGSTRTNAFMSWPRSTDKPFRESGAC